MKKATSSHNSTAVNAQTAEPIMTGGARKPSGTLPSARQTKPTKPGPTKVPANGRPNYGKEDGNFDAEQVLAALMTIKKGDFSIRLPVDWTGIAGKVADTFNEVAELMSNSTEELNRVSRVVGKEGRIQERMTVGHVTGGWSERVNSVNNLIESLAQPIRETARV